MSQLSKDHFNRVTFQEERDSIFGDLIRYRVKLLGRGKESEKLFQFIATTIVGDRMECELDNESSEDAEFFSVGRLVVLQFTLNVEKFFIKATVTASRTGLYSFSLSDDIYHLQRRENFRISVPVGLQSRLKIKNQNGFHVDSMLNIKDMSAGGMKAVALKDRSIKFTQGDRLSAVIDVDLPKGLIDCELEVMHVFNGESPQGPIVTLGLKFNPLSSMLESRVLALVMEIYRQHYLV